jgi:uncharacterized membrane protein YhaH (DUF805 family)
MIPDDASPAYRAGLRYGQATIVPAVVLLASLLTAATVGVAMLRATARHGIHGVAAAALMLAVEVVAYPVVIVVTILAVSWTLVVVLMVVLALTRLVGVARGGGGGER